MKISKLGGQLALMRRRKRKKPSSAVLAFYSTVISDISPRGCPSLQNSHIETRKDRYFLPMRKGYLTC
jgi:hypothetical protein